MASCLLLLKLVGSQEVERRLSKMAHVDTVRDVVTAIAGGDSVLHVEAATTETAK